MASEYKDQLGCLLEIFSRFDMDNDGSLTILELAALLRFLGINPMGNQIHLLWTNMEVNGNGYVELEAAVESVPRPKTMPDLTYSTTLSTANFLRSSYVRGGMERV
ncbi:hypothetical protein HN873_040943 [Arachis hypogaea]